MTADLPNEFYVGVWGGGVGNPWPPRLAIALTADEAVRWGNPELANTRSLGPPRVFLIDTDTGSRTEFRMVAVKPHLERVE